MTNVNFPRSMFVGFDSLFDQIERTKETPKYPPYNIKELSNSDYAIEIAVAGFDESDLTVTREKNQLTVYGVCHIDDDAKYIHKSISGKNFTRTFTLASDVEVGSTTLINGILTINLKRVIPEEDKPIQIKINSDQPQLLNE
jgi:molecular chaperone IbpA